MSCRLVAGDGGVFEITVGDELLFSKAMLGRFPEDDEALRLVRQRLQP